MGEVVVINNPEAGINVGELIMKISIDAGGNIEKLSECLKKYNIQIDASKIFDNVEGASALEITRLTSALRKDLNAKIQMAMSI